MLWDGLGFFGTDHMKLGRLKGEKVTFCTMFSSPRTLVLTLILMVLGISLIITEAQKLNKPKSQTIYLEEDIEFYYDFSDAIALRSGNWFYVDRVFDHIREHQVRNR